MKQLKCRMCGKVPSITLRGRNLSPKKNSGNNLLSTTPRKDYGSEIMKLKTKPTIEPMLVDVKGAMIALDISRAKLSELTNAGEIPRLKIGRAVRYRVADLRKWIDKQVKV